MIIDFWVENYLSIRDRQYLSFIAKGHESECVVKMSDGTLLYKLAILFGANASGKTNILTAIEEIFGLMTIPNMGIKQNIDSHEPFCLTKDEPTKMHISFYVDDKRYDYDIDYD